MPWGTGATLQWLDRLSHEGTSACARGMNPASVCFERDLTAHVQLEPAALPIVADAVLQTPSAVMLEPLPRDTTLQRPWLPDIAEPSMRLRRSRINVSAALKPLSPSVVAPVDAEAMMVQPHDPLAAEARRFFQERLRHGLQAALGEMSGQPLTREQARLAERLQRTLQQVYAEETS